MKKKIGVPIRVQMFGGFLVSILFIILVGSISYQRAADSLIANYTSSTRNTIRMTVTSLDDSLKNVQNALSELSQDANVKSYALGGLKNNVSAQQSTRKLLNNNIMVKQTATDMIYSINIITVDDEQFLTTQRMDATGDDSFLSELEQSKDGYLLEEDGIYWGSTHPFLGEKLMTEESAYPLFCSRTVSSGDITALVVIDVSSEAILQLLEQLDMGEDSQISFISEGGKEIKNGDVTDISQSEFFLNNRDNITEDGKVRMMLTGQVFAIMSGTATDAQIAEIAKSADTYLYDETCGGYRLNTDFGEIKTDMGRMFGFAYGEKENGAVFSHMAVMYANALYQRGFAKEGYKAMHSLYAQSMDFDKSHIYPGIPEYFGRNGRGLYHYLTGAASWYMMTVMNQMFGVRGCLGALRIEPKLVEEQFDERGTASIKFRFQGLNWCVSFENAGRKEYGQYRITEAYMDDAPIALQEEHSIVIGRDMLAKLDTNITHKIIVKLN